VPDEGTLLIGGQKLNFETENEKGVPVLSKLPFGIGRLFKNNNSQTSQDVLLILVKPTIIIQSETEEDAFSAI
jgi:type II secretory pathway component GspD/PulD (secretin)